MTIEKVIGTGYLRTHPHRPLWQASGSCLEGVVILGLGISEVSPGVGWVGEEAGMVADRTVDCRDIASVSRHLTPHKPFPPHARPVGERGGNMRKRLGKDRRRGVLGSA